MENRIKELRKKRGMNQEALASFLGVSQQTISKIERNMETMSIDLLIHSADYFNVTTDYILGLSDEKRNRHRENVASRKIESYYDFVVEFEKLDESNRKILLVIMRALKDSQR